jgi:hypothetical protein
MNKKMVRSKHISLVRTRKTRNDEKRQNEEE